MAKLTKVGMYIYCTEADQAAIKKQAAKESRKISAFVMRVINDYLQRIKRGEVLPQ